MYKLDVSGRSMRHVRSSEVSNIPFPRMNTFLGLMPMLSSKLTGAGRLRTSDLKETPGKKWPFEVQHSTEIELTWIPLVSGSVWMLDPKKLS
jgi:hypothetical protein